MKLGRVSMLDVLVLKCLTFCPLKPWRMYQICRFAMPTWSLLSIFLGVSCEISSSAAVLSSALLQNSVQQSVPSGQMTPCQSDSAFKAERLMQPFCDMSSVMTPPDAASCNARDGCSYSENSCICEVESGCVALGGRWQSWTCKNEMDSLMLLNRSVFEEAKAAGTCDGFELDGLNLKEFVTTVASQCCSDYPSTFCERNVHSATPCSKPSDFLPSALIWSHCSLGEVMPTNEQCMRRPGCFLKYGTCTCTTEGSCQAMGGSFTGSTCESFLTSWRPELHRALAQASMAKTCRDLPEEPRSTMSQVGLACCASGKSICQELDS